MQLTPADAGGRQGGGALAARCTGEVGSSPMPMSDRSRSLARGGGQQGTASFRPSLLRARLGTVMRATPGLSISSALAVWVSVLPVLASFDVA